MRTAIVLLVCLALSPMATLGCKTSGGASGFAGGILVGSPQPSPAPKPPLPPPSRGQEQAGRNSLRNAYKFLEKGMPDHALKELDKAESRLGRDFWYNYYRAGALHMMGRPREAQSYWDVALSAAGSDGLRSRIRVCQSFGYFALDLADDSVRSLELALRLDSGNATARVLLDDSRSDDGRLAEGHGKGQKGDDRGKGRDKGDEDRGKVKGKAKKLGSRDQFAAYFLVEAPD